MHGFKIHKGHIGKEDCDNLNKLIADSFLSDVKINKQYGRITSLDYQPIRYYPYILEWLFPLNEYKISHIMAQTYTDDYLLPMHVDGDYSKIIIFNTLGEGDFKIDSVPYAFFGSMQKIEEDIRTYRIHAGDVVVMEGDAVKLPHGASRMICPRNNIVLRLKKGFDIYGT